MHPCTVEQKVNVKQASLEIFLSGCGPSGSFPKMLIEKTNAKDTNLSSKDMIFINC